MLAAYQKGSSWFYELVIGCKLTVELVSDLERVSAGRLRITRPTGSAVVGHDDSAALVINGIGIAVASNDGS